jgi:hypothetical protein
MALAIALAIPAQLNLWTTLALCGPFKQEVGRGSMLLQSIRFKRNMPLKSPQAICDLEREPLEKVSALHVAMARFTL